MTAFSRYSFFLTLLLFLIASVATAFSYETEREQYNFLNYVNQTKSPHKTQAQQVKPIVNKPIEAAAEPQNSEVSPQQQSSLQPVNYSASAKEMNHSEQPKIETFLVVPVLSEHSSMTAYGDLVKLVASDFAIHLRDVALQHHLYYTVIQPTEAERSIQQLGLNGVYHDIIQDYRLARRPDPDKIQFFINKFNETGNHLTGIVFLESNFNPMGSTAVTRTIKSPIRRILDISSIFNMPENMDVNYQADAIATLFNTRNEDSMLVWQQQSSSRMPLQSLGGFQSSVYSTDMGLQRFSALSHTLSNNLVSTFPGVAIKEKEKQVAEKIASPPGLKTVKQVFAEVKGWAQGD